MNYSLSAIDKLSIFAKSGGKLVLGNLAKSVTRRIHSVNLSEQKASDWIANYLPNVTGVSLTSGMAQVQQTFVSIRWAWLTLSVALVLLGLIQSVWDYTDIGS